MSNDALKLTIYFSERDRAGHGLLADALFDLYERHRLRTSVLLRGISGFGARHQLQSDRLLTLSESLPAVWVAVDTRERIEETLPELLELTGHRVISLEHARLHSGGEVDLRTQAAGALQLTVYGGRAIRSSGQAGYVAAVDALREAGVAGASVLLGVDGTLHGERRRARFFARNAGVPLMLLAVGEPAAISAALPRVTALIEEPVVTLEQVQLHPADGAHEPGQSGLAVYKKLIVNLEEQAKVDGHPLHVELVRRLAQAGAAGATVLRGVRGTYAGREPVADRFLSLRRNVPVHVVVVDAPEAMERWWPVVEELTAEAGLVTISSGSARANHRALAAPLRDPPSGAKPD